MNPLTVRNIYSDLFFILQKSPGSRPLQVPRDWPHEACWVSTQETLACSTDHHVKDSKPLVCFKGQSPKEGYEGLANSIWESKGATSPPPKSRCSQDSKETEYRISRVSGAATLSLKRATAVSLQSNHRRQDLEGITGVIQKAGNWLEMQSTQLHPDLLNRKLPVGPSNQCLIGSAGVTEVLRVFFSPLTPLH